VPVHIQAHIQEVGVPVRILEEEAGLAHTLVAAHTLAVAARMQAAAVHKQAAAVHKQAAADSDHPSSAVEPG
jgi:hypothetical protein